MFDHKGVIGIAKDSAEEDEVFEVAIEAGAEDMTPGDEQYDIVTAPQDFDTVKSAFTAKGWTLTTAELAWIPQTQVAPDEKHVSKIETILGELEDNEDVTAVHTNYSPPQ
jgi:transcriptional/translational regulatory protein YebC/TACO1